VIEALIGVQLGVAALVLFGAGRQLAERFPRAREAIAVGRWVALAGCITLLGGGLFGDLTPEHDTPNPEPNTVRSVGAGAALFGANCAACHGADGRGGGPMASTTPTRPADLRSGHLPSHTDGDLYYWIGAGLPGGMPAWAGRLSETDRWNLVNFLRALDGRPVPPDSAAPSAPAAASVIPGLMAVPPALALGIGWLATGLRRARRR
jgi:mono/diheme cytochrome c family protein